MSDKEQELLQEDLLTQLLIWAEDSEEIYGWDAYNGRCYNKLKEIVEEHFQRKDFTKGYEIKQIQQKPDEDTAEWMDRCHELELEVARLQEKLEVGDD